MLTPETSNSSHPAGRGAHDETWTLIKFIVTGGTAALLFVALAAGSRSLGWPPFWASTLGYVVAFSFAYTVQRRWTFNARHAHNQAFPRYLSAQIGCGLMAGALSHVLVHVWAFPPLAMAGTVTLLTSAVSFALSRWWVFRPRRARPVAGSDRPA